MRRWLLLGCLLLALCASACGRTVGGTVSDGTYHALVPSTQQLASDDGGNIPGGFIPFRDDDVDRIDLLIAGDELRFRLDGTEVIRHVIERVDVTDREGSGPFKAIQQVLILGEDALILGGLVIDEPVIWPGNYDEWDVVTVKSWNPEDRGPVVSCRTDEACLLLASDLDPIGRYDNANNPELDENPITSIEVAGEFVEFTLPTGNQVRISRTDESITACGLSASTVWDVPAQIELSMDDPVLIHTLCPSNPGGAIQLIIIERSSIPLLAPLGTETGGDWCNAGPKCLWFVPT